MKTYCSHCDIHEYVCSYCGRTYEERQYWEQLPTDIQKDIANRIHSEEHMAERLLIQLQEITDLQNLLNSRQPGKCHV